MMATLRRNLLPGLLLAVVVVGAVPALAQMIWQARLFGGRAAFPLDLEWMEGGVLVHAQRMVNGQGIYVAPSLEFIPFLYPPLYPALLALLSALTPLGYLMGRLLSILAFAVALATVVVSAWHEGFPARRPIARLAHRPLRCGCGSRQLRLHGVLLRLGASRLTLVGLGGAGFMARLSGARLAQRGPGGRLDCLGFLCQADRNCYGHRHGSGSFARAAQAWPDLRRGGHGRARRRYRLSGRDLTRLVLDLHIQASSEPRLPQRRGY